MSSKAAIIGAGLIGRAWAIAFARGGWSCALWDPDPDAASTTRESARGLIESLEAEGLLGEPVDAIMARIDAAPTLNEALDGAAWMQENAPEKLEVKEPLWAEIDAVAGSDTILASSSSAIVPSKFTETLSHRAHCLVCHPLNPPYLLPAVELVPAPWTDPATMAEAERVMKALGQAPIVMQRELDGFVMNRMQGALFEEAFRLVADGYCTAEDIDIGIREGLAVRWSIIGPFETGDLNAPGGIRDYVNRYQHIYVGLHEDQKRRVDWAGPVLDDIEAARREKLPADKLGERQGWRDRQLMALALHRLKARERLGD